MRKVATRIEIEKIAKFLIAEARQDFRAELITQEEYDLLVKAAKLLLGPNPKETKGK